ncbi:GNAT family N-acetyltransferase [Neisseria sp. Ec49-e6-T10]|uniref:GNAT family N-acetyltransferase n=1 Tax=Neisseria sp. Ec49-e6-T10 TaxID=3140744 RepID=UPI003EBFC8B8
MSAIKWKIEPYQLKDHDALVDIWLRAVKQTHHFLDESDISFFHKIVSEQALSSCPVWQIKDQQEIPVGFIGIDQQKIEMLFVEPDKHGHGIGSLLMDFAIKEHQVTAVDVNEQNVLAMAFYQKHGFEVIGRSPFDGTGRPFPILHMSLLSI